jgi:murein L,D-transpeptidase YafK
MRAIYQILLLFFFTSFINYEKPSIISLKAEQIPKNKFYITIKKSDYELNVYDSAGLYASYPVVFGNKDQSDKLYNGDKRTPIGNYTIIAKMVHKKWGPELLLDYPTLLNKIQFNTRKNKGLISKDATMGYGIAIHGTRPQEEWTVDNRYNWTDGCISLKYTDMKVLYSYIPSGTKVTIYT